MKRVIACWSGSVLFAALGLSALAHEGHDHKKASGTKSSTVIGELVDTACFVSSNGDAVGKGHAKCATKCMSTGVPAAVLPEGSKDAKAMLFLLTNPVPLAPHAAKTIKVEGTARPDLHAMDVKKVYVKEGDNWREVQLSDEHHKTSGAEKKDAKGDGHKDHKH